MSRPRAPARALGRHRRAGSTTGFHGAPGVRTLLRKIFPDHWTFLLGEIALYSFIILLLTGTFLTFFFQPSMTDVDLPRHLHAAATACR